MRHIEEAIYLLFHDASLLMWKKIKHTLTLLKLVQWLRLLDRVVSALFFARLNLHKNVVDLSPHLQVTTVVHSPGGTELDELDDKRFCAGLLLAKFLQDDVVGAEQTF